MLEMGGGPSTLPRPEDTHFSGISMCIFGSLASLETSKMVYRPSKRIEYGSYDVGWAGKLDGLPMALDETMCFQWSGCSPRLVQVLGAR